MRGRNLPQSIIVLTPSPSTLRLIRDSGSALYNRVNIVGYEKCEDDIQTVSGMVEDIRDALLDYQVCSNEPHIFKLCH